jgi:tRNA-guanine family transglycosylase
VLYEYGSFTKENMNLESSYSKAECFNAKRIKRIDLNEAAYINDFGPLQKGCECFTCKNHTRSYVNHLLKVKEMTGNVLLVLHNMFLYERFFDEMRLSLVLEKPQEFVEWFMNSQTENFVEAVQKLEEKTDESKKKDSSWENKKSESENEKNN